MNWRVWALALALAIPQAEPQRVPVEGVVRDAQTGTPISGAQLRLSGTLPGETRPTTISGVSAADGTFRLLALPAEYTLSAQREGYFGQTVYGVWQTASSQKIKVSAGQLPTPLPQLTFNLTATGVITGQVVDHNGRPASRVPVAAMQTRYAEGRSTMIAVNSGTTNERGEYRLFWVPPGDYLVAFNPLTSILTPPVITTGNIQSIQTLTFFPGTTDRSRARTVSLASGKEIRNVDFAIQTVPVFTISGRVDYLFPPAPVGLPGYSLLSKESLTPNPVPLSNANSVPMLSRQQGLFEFRAIASGTYDLFATVPAGNGQPSQFGRTSINVGSQDLKDITIPVQPVFELHGRVVPHGIRLPESTTLRLLLIGRANLPAEARMGSSGEFRFNNLLAGDFRLEVGLPDGAFVADLPSNVFQLPTGTTEPLTITVRGDAGRITGTATSADGKVGTDTTVVLVPERQLRRNSMLFATARPDETGRFSMTRLAPGTYKLFAWEGVLNTAWLNAEFLSGQEDRGIPLTIDPDAVRDVRITATPPQE
jgi:hypothetical protein